MYLRSLTASRERKVELTFKEAAELAEDGEPLFECIKDDELYTAYTDCDHYCETIEIPSEDTIDDIQEQMMNNLGRLINDQFTDEHKGTFGIATRHGIDSKKQVYKLSWRCYFFGFVITPAEMKNAIVRKGLDKGSVGCLDSSPYSKNQLLGCVGFPKSKTDRRVLLPVDDNISIDRYMVQNITGEEVMLKYDEELDETVEEVLHHPTENFEHPRFAPPWEILDKLVMSLDVHKRCEKGTYLTWAKIGWAINGVARAAKRFDAGLDLWLRFCRQCMDAYLEDPMKARLIYSCAKTREQQLGWKSLMEALREDDLGLHQQIAKQLRDINGAEGTTEDELKIIKKFVYTSFHHKPNDIGQIIVKSYDDGNYIIVNTTEDRPYCPLFEGEHEPVLHPYVVIGLKTAKNKCRHPDCKDKTDIVIEFASYSLDLKTIVTRLLRKVETPEEAISKFVRQRKATDFPEMADSDLELDVPKSTIFGQRYPLVRNTFCLICKCRHEKPENCIFVNRAANLLAMECRLNHDSVHPPDGIIVPQNVTNVIIQNNYIHADREDLEDDIFDEEFHIFPDGELNRLVNISLKGFASDVARVFVHLGRDLFGVQTGDRDTWWAWDTQEMRWLQSQHKANIFCDSVLAEHYARVMTWLRLHSPDNDKRTKPLQRIEHLLKRLKDRDQHSILAQAAILLKEEKRNFEFMLDANKDLLNFKGQVFDFEEMAVRDIRPTDYVSLSTGYELPEINLAKRTKVITIIQSIMPDRQHVDYLLLHLAGCLDGWNREETFSILSGTGRYISLFPTQFLKLCVGGKK